MIKLIGTIEDNKQALEVCYMLMDYLMDQEHEMDELRCELSEAYGDGQEEN